MKKGQVHPDPVKALVIRAAGTNCDQETVHALAQSGAKCELVHVNQLLLGRIRLHPYQILVIPGGFSYGDDISAGKVLANELKFKLKDQLNRFVKADKLIIGVCNGFQVLVKTGLLPGFDNEMGDQKVTLSLNDSARFQCEWVKLSVEKSAAQWLSLLPKNMELPIAHAEGKFITTDTKTLKTLKQHTQVVFRYAPRNPNGSEDAIAGICNKKGNVVGLMPHPERYMTKYEHPHWTGLSPTETNLDGDGAFFWKQAINYAKTLIN